MKCNHEDQVHVHMNESDGIRVVIYTTLIPLFGAVTDSQE